MNVRYSIIVGFATAAMSLYAEAPDRDWSLALGLGGRIAPVYAGSSEYGGRFIPLIDARYRLGNGELFVSVFDGAGASYTLPDWGLTVSGGVTLGIGRSEDDASSLKGTADLSNPIAPYFSLKYGCAFGSLSAKIEFHPVQASFSGHPDIDYDALLLAFGYEVEGNLTECFSFLLGLGLSLMNRDYAAAYYGIEYPTENLAAYESEAGLHDVSFSARALYMATKHVGLIAAGKIYALFPEASRSDLADSPYGGELCVAIAYIF